MEQALTALLAKALLPAPDSGPADTCPPSDLLHRQALGREQDDTGTLNVLQRTRPIATIVFSRALSAAARRMQTV
jgi:hypothetical protein